MDALISKNAPAHGNRIAIRLLFPGFLVCAVLLWGIRTTFGEPYPGPFMPAFKGTGLHMISDRQAEIIASHITVTFTDHTTDELTLNRLFADGPASSHLGMLYLIAPNPNPPEKTKGIRKTLRDWFARHVSSYREPEVNTKWTVNDDVRAYLQRRLASLYPSKTAVSLTIVMNKVYFSIDNFHTTDAVLDSQKTITFDEHS